MKYYEIKKGFCLLLAIILAFACLTMEAGAVQVEPEANTLSIERASGRFSVDVGKQSTFTADSTFPLDIGDTVAIRNHSDSTVSVSGTVTY